MPPLLVAGWPGPYLADRTPILPVTETHTIQKITHFQRRGVTGASA